MKKEQPRLLKFCGPTEYALKNLWNRVVYCQHYQGFNDPFEFWTDFHRGIPDLETERGRFIAAVNAWGFGEDRLDEALEHAPEYFSSVEALQPPFEAMADGMRIACFCSEPVNLLMWSHYADGLRGFCIVFDEQLVTNTTPKGFIIDVAYLEKPPLVDSFVYAVSHDQEDYHVMAIQEARPRGRYQRKTESGLITGYREAADTALKHMREMWQHAFAAKPLEWRYEKERRLLVPTDRQDREPIFREYPKRAVREIVVGEKMPAGYLRRLASIVKERYGKIPLRTARRSSDVYKLIIE